MSKILIVEDEKEIADHLHSLLNREGFYPLSVHTKAEAGKAIAEEEFDLILLDLALPDGNGYSLCTAIKRRHGTPIIFLTAMGDEDSIVTGFDLGADDYIVKPFKPLELVSRIKNILRRYGKQPSLFVIDDLKIDANKAKVYKQDKEILLTALEYRLLLVFINHPGEVLSRNRLLEEIWDIAGDYVNDNTLTVYIKRLREKIETEPSLPAILKTVRGLGYMIGD